MLTKTIGNPPECDPLYEQACDEVGKVFGKIPDSVMIALDIGYPGWYARTQTIWVTARCLDLRARQDEARNAYDEP